MTAASDPQTTPRSGEESEIVLRLGDILPRVPDHLISPGPHDFSAQIRFSLEELAEKIARGRVTVPLERLATAYPGVFRATAAQPAEKEIPLPLQKLLEQVGLVARKPPSPNGLPVDQIAQARARA